MSAMRLAIILSAGRSEFGGIETSADGLGAALAARGHEIVLIAGSLSPLWRQLPAARASVEVRTWPAQGPAARRFARLVRIPPPHLRSLSFFARFLASSKARKALATCDVALTFIEGEAVLFARYLARSPVATVYYFPGAIDRRWARRDRSTRRVAVSHVVAENTAALPDYPTHGVVWPGVSGELLRQACRAERASAPRRLLFVGRLEAAAKRPDRLLPLLAALAHEFPDLTLRFVGGGPQRPALEAEARLRGIAGRVTFVGPQPPSAVRAEFAAADISLVPSTFESFGLSALEALAAGVPLVASDLAGLREATGGHACLLPPDDLPAWRDATRRLLLDAELRAEAARAGRAFAAGMTWERAARELEPHLFDARRTSAPAASAAPAQARRDEREDDGGTGDP